MTSEDRTHLNTIPPSSTQALRKWLERPSGSFTPEGQSPRQPRFSFEAVSGGGLMLRTWPFNRGEEGNTE